MKDGTEYAKIIAYARYLDEREQLGGAAGQMTLGMAAAVSDEEGEKPVSYTHLDVYKRQDLF